MEGKQQLLTALHQIIADLETVGGDTIPDMGLVGLKLETLGEAALLNGDNCLVAIDLINQARQLCVSSGAYSSYRSYEAPVLRQEGRRGRPKFDITEEQLLFFREHQFSNQEMALMLGVSKRTVERRMTELHLTNRSRYTDIEDDMLDSFVQRIITNFPRSGMKTIEGCLVSQGVRVQRSRLRNSLKRVDPVGRRLRSINVIRRRVYNVRSPLSLWHMHGNHKLVRSRLPASSSELSLFPSLSG
ncbi:uncharacterized protein [Montipora foliosa]|uniref:uncharacterized protein n=1 Tax=Montipora foliosa TaxID=591990 RepID=UPI0035F1BA17